jgi:hypothetical protein
MPHWRNDAMRVVEYHGVAVKRQRKISKNEMVLTFYNKDPQVVSVRDWAKYSNSKFYNDDVRRCDVVRK